MAPSGLGRLERRSPPVLDGVRRPQSSVPTMRREVSDVRRPSPRRLGERSLDDVCHGLCGDAAALAVLRLQPDLQISGALARVARKAAAGDVLSCDDAHVVDDVLPRGLAPPGGVSGHERNTAIDAVAIPFDNLSLEPRGDPPAVHAPSPSVSGRWRSESERRLAGRGTSPWPPRRRARGRRTARAGGGRPCRCRCRGRRGAGRAWSRGRR